MAPRKTANTNGNGNTATVEPIAQQDCNPFSEESLETLLDTYAEPIAVASIRDQLPKRVRYHIHRLLTSDRQEDREQLRQMLIDAKISIAFCVFHEVLRQSKELTDARLSGSVAPQIKGSADV